MRSLEHPSTRTIDCHLREKFNGSCAKLPFYEEYDGERYCVLHLPSHDKASDFKKVVQAKVGRRDFNFAGAFFPADTAVFVGFEYVGTNFSGATFGGAADFSGATFGDAADFREALFDEGVDFSGTTFTGEASFSRAIFKERVVFIETAFRGGRVNFSNTVFEQAVLFFATIFNLQAHVDFRGARIGMPEMFSFQRTQLRASWFVDIDPRLFYFTLVEWYGLPNGPEGSLMDEIEALQERGLNSPHWLLQEASRRLSLNAKERGAYQTAGEFHYWASDITRRWGWRTTSLAEYWGTVLHWILNGYGERPYRAFLMLLAIWGIFALLYMAAGPEELKALSALLALDPREFFSRASGAVSYSLGVMVRLNPKPDTTPGFFQFLVSVEGSLGPLQFAMFVIAVRRYIPWLAEAVGRGGSR